MLAEPTSASSEIQEQVIQKLAEERFKGWTEVAKKEAEAFYTTQMNGFLDEARKEIGKRDDDIQKLSSLVDAQKRAIEELKEQQDRPSPGPQPPPSPGPQPPPSPVSPQLAEILADKEKLEKQLDENKKSADQEKKRVIKRFTDEKNLLNQQIDSLKKTNDEIGEKMKLSSYQLKKVQSESGKTVKELNELKVNHDQLLKDAKSTVDQLKTSQSTAMHIQKKVKELEEARVAESQSALGIEQNLAVKLKTVLGQLQALQKSSKAEITSITENKEQLTNKYETKIKELNLVIDEMTKSENKINNRLKKELALVLKEKKKLESEKTSLDSQLKTNESTQKTLENNILNMTKLITDANEKIESFESLNLNQASVISKLQGEIAKKSEELSIVDTFYSSRLNAAKSELQSELDSHVASWQKEKWSLVEAKKSVEDALNEVTNMVLLSNNAGFQSAESDMHAETYHIASEPFTGTKAELKQQLVEVLVDNPILELPTNVIPPTILEIKQILPYKELAIVSQLPAEEATETSEMIWENARNEVRAIYYSDLIHKRLSPDEDGIEYQDDNPEHEKIKKTWNQAVVLGQTLEAFWSTVNNDNLASTLQQHNLPPTEESIRQLLIEGNLYDLAKEDDRDRLFAIVKKLGYVKGNISVDMFEKTLAISDLILEGIAKLGGNVLHELDINNIEDWSFYEDTIRKMASFVFSNSPSRLVEVENALKAFKEGGAVGSEEAEELINEEEEEKEYERFIESRHQAYTSLSKQQKEDLAAHLESYNIPKFVPVEKQPQLSASGEEPPPPPVPIKQVSAPSLKRKTPAPPQNKELEVIPTPKKTVRDEVQTILKKPITDIIGPRPKAFEPEQRDWDRRAEELLNERAHLKAAIDLSLQPKNPTQSTQLEQKQLFGKRLTDVTKRDIVEPFTARKEYLANRRKVEQRLKRFNANKSKSRLGAATF
jgi:hypothetical protein